MTVDMDAVGGHFTVLKGDRTGYDDADPAGPDIQFGATGDQIVRRAVQTLAALRILTDLASGGNGCAVDGHSAIIGTNGSAVRAVKGQTCPLFPAADSDIRTPEVKNAVELTVVPAAGVHDVLTLQNNLHFG